MMKLRVMERWVGLQLLPPEGNLATMLIVNKLRKKLGISEEEMEELHMITGVICDKCGNPVENRGTEAKPEYYCLVCNDFVDTKGVPNQTIWNQAADIGKDIEFTKAERGIFIAAIGKADTDKAITPAQAAFWEQFIEAYPGADTVASEEVDK